MFDVIAGLPAHPLIVHLPVVLLPLAAIGLILLAAKASWRPRYALALLAILIVGSFGAIFAWASGNALAERLGRPEGHATAGLVLMVSSVALLFLGGAWLLWVRRGESTKAKDVSGWIVSLLGVIVVVCTILAGHSGATAAWGGRLPAAGPSPSSTGSPAGSSSPAPSAGPSSSAEPSEATTSPSVSQSPGFTMAQVQEHATQESCWAAISGNVYDLTGWINQHPGGSARIVALCGTDATAAFENQHSGNPRPAEQLQEFLLGPLS